MTIARLCVAALVAMSGLVWLVNTSRYGPAGALGGLALTVMGVVLARGAFRRHPE